MSKTLSFLVLFTLIPSIAVAQIIPDSSLGTENSVVETDGNRDTIGGGAIRDANLFHSFQELTLVNEGIILEVVSKFTLLKIGKQRRYNHSTFS